MTNETITGSAPSGTIRYATDNLHYACILLLVLLWISPLPAQIPPGYYDTAQGKTGLVLVSALHQIIHNHTSWPYSSTSTDTSDGLKDLDEDPANTNNVICIYSRTTNLTTWIYTLAFPRRTNGMIETTFTNPPSASLILYRLYLQ